MEIDNNNVDRKYLRAKKRVDELKKYYRHLSIYIAVNTILSVFKVVNDIRGGDSFEEALFDFDNFSLWIWWGIGIAFHTYKVFGGRLLFLNKDWEDKKIKEYMNEK
tara:strand:+ start:2662 stop:2979 length:318 start_codon:yes stop_codon:yes gene_type:complete